jgi:hypothetical protein
MAIEVEEVELETLRNGMKLLHAMSNNPAARVELQKAVKAVNPEFKTEEEQANELAAPHLAKVEALIKPISERFEKMDADALAAADAAAKTRLEDGFANIRSNSGATDEGIEATKKIMIERNIADPEAAWLLYLKNNPPPVQAPSASAYSPERWAITETEDDLKEWFSNPDKKEDKEIAKILTEMRQGAQAAV